MSQASAAPLAFVRRHRRAHRSPQQRSDRFTGLYTVGLYAAIGAWIGFQALRQSPARGGSSVWLTGGGLARAGTVVLLLGLLAALRYATWQGPVVFSAPDVHFLLGAPLPRAELVRDRLARGLLLGAGVGVALGLGAFVLLEAELGVGAWPLLAAALTGPAALGVLVAALGWLVESSPATARVVLRASPLVLAVAVAAWLGGVAAAKVDPWSGPWGWAVGPLVAAAGGHDPGWPVQAALLAAITAAAVIAAWQTAARVTLEELERRAGTRAGLGASLFMADPRGAALLRHEAVRGLLGVRRLRLHHPRHRWLAVPWRDALSLLRAPGRVGWALVLCGGGVLTVAAAPDHRLLAAGAVVVAYLGAAQLVEPVRGEADQPDASRQFPWRWGDLILLHTVTPILTLTVAGLALSITATLFGLLPGVALGMALAACLPVAAALVWSAAIAGQRGRLGPDQLVTASAMGELGGPMYLARWFATGPLVALVVLLPPVLVLQGAAGRPSPHFQAAASNAAFLLVVALAIQGAWLRSRHPPD
ncbi:MAG TPA: hypothetical protein VGA45_04740 [Actinomycetota bacterium]